MDNKIRVYILGQDTKALDDIAIKLNKTRPVLVSVFGSLKSFLMEAMKGEVDIIAISMSLNHSKVSQFPKFFRMALNAPSITFSESDKQKEIKAVNLSQSDYKISGKLTSHNLWMKLVHFKKQKENQQRQAEKGEEAPVRSGGNGGMSQKQASTFVASTGDGGHQMIKSQNIESIMDQLNSISEQDKAAKAKWGNQSGASGPVHVKSSEATKYKRENIAEQMAKKADQKIPGEDLESEPSGGSSGTMTMKPEGGKKRSARHYHIKSESADEEFSSDEESAEGLIGNLKSSQPGEGIQHVTSSLASTLNSLENPDEGQALAQGNESGSSMATGAHGDSSGNHVGGAVDESAHATGKEPIEPQFEEPDLKANDYPGEEEDDGYYYPDMKKLLDGPKARARQKKREDKQKKKEEETLRKQEEAEANTGETGDVLDTGEENTEGVANGAEDSEGPEKDEQTKQAELQARIDEAPNKTLRKKGPLEIACEDTLKEEYEAKILEEPRSFEANQFSVFTIDQGQYKGYLIFSNSFNHKESVDVLAQIKEKISENLRTKGISAEVGSFYQFDVPTVDYINWANEVCEFTTVLEDEGTNKQFLISFLEREMVYPPFTEDKERKMITVDLQQIPPDTKVNFDAFIYLPKNERFVQYLKDQRSLSLNQIKRLLDVDEAKKIFIPSEEKSKYILFCIKNTVIWEIESYLKQKKDAA